MAKMWVWPRGRSTGGVVIGAGVDDRLVRGLVDDVHGFSGREVSGCCVVFGLVFVI